jgi:ABC-type cobalamin/Fe3+-siderophores transport system ATPase subunit
MTVEIVLSNYRCFSDQQPARFAIRDGFTAFLGVNNSGKSSILRMLYEFRNLFRIALGSPQFLHALLKTKTPFDLQGVGDNVEVCHNQNTRDVTITLAAPEIGLVNPARCTVPKQVAITVYRGTNTFTIDVGGGLPGGGISFLDGILSHNNQPLYDLAPYQQICANLGSTVYLGPFRNAINVGSTENYYDIGIGQALIRRWKSMKTGPAKASNEAIYNLTQDIARLFGFSSLEINASDNDTTLQFMIEGKSYTLLELGAGLAQFVTSLMSVAVQKPAYILIDEPELNLHPSLQLDFLTTLASYAHKGVLFATHSYGLARARAQNVYTLRRDSANGFSSVSPLESTPRLSELLGELSFSAFRELGFDRILLVEGVTEVLAIQQFLRMYEKDHKIVIVPLGGGSLINGTRGSEIEELKRITPRIAAVIDSERDGEGSPLEKSREQFAKLCEGAGIICHILKRRAIENYLSNEAIVSEKGEQYKALGPFQKLKEADPTWSKNENWRIARRMAKADIATTDLGEFLEIL